MAPGCCAVFTSKASCVHVPKFNNPVVSSDKTVYLTPTPVVIIANYHSRVTIAAKLNMVALSLPVAIRQELRVLCRSGRPIAALFRPDPKS